jgi:glycosyltransferase 2 family protein
VSRRLFSHVKKFLPLVGVILFIFTIYMLDIDKIIDAFLSINPIYLLISLPLTLPRLLIRNTAWQIIQREQNIHIPFWTSLKIFLIGYFYGSITPAYIGQLMRIPYMNEETDEPYGKLFINSFLETTLHTLSLYGMIFFGALLVLSSFPQLIYLIIIWFAILTVIIAFFIEKTRGEKAFHFLIRYFTPSQLRVYLTRFVGTFYHDFPKFRRLALPTFVAMFTWIIIFTQEYILVIALDLDIPYIYFLLLFPVANAAGFLPITFAGLGTREFTAVIIFSTLFNIPGEKIFVVSLLGFIITDIATGLIGFFVALLDARTKGVSLKGRKPFFKEGQT